MPSKKRRSPPQFAETKHDEIGFWSEIKLDILKAYWPEYTKILNKQSWDFRKLYVDAFAGSGLHVSRRSGEFVKGSPARALDVMPPFDEYHFVDLDEAKVLSLEKLASSKPCVHVHHGDCNEILVNEIFPLAKYEEYRRALCLLDPYSLQLDWTVTAQAGEMRSIEIFLNFPIMDINRSVLRPGASQSKVRDMNRFWGDETWRDAAYRKEPMLFGEPEQQKVENWEIVKAFQRRLNKKANFKFVPEPLAMRNSKRATVYYLFFASNNETGSKIVDWIFNDYRSKGYG